MPYLVLARKFRPQLFEELVGQEHVTQTLTNALKSQRLAHAYIFSGPRGCGKTTTARILAKNPRDAEALVLRGQVKKGSVDLGDAMADFRKAIPLLDAAIESAPREATWYQLRASALQGLGEEDQAVSDLKKALLLDPNQRLWEIRLQMLESVVGLKRALRQSTSSREADSLRAAPPPEGSNALPLLRFLADQDALVRRDAALAAGTTGEGGYLPTLKKMLRDPDPQVREAARKSISLLE